MRQDNPFSVVRPLSEGHVPQDNPFPVERHGSKGHMFQINLFSVERSREGLNPLAVGLVMDKCLNLHMSHLDECPKVWMSYSYHWCGLTSACILCPTDWFVNHTTLVVLDECPLCMYLILHMFQINLFSVVRHDSMLHMSHSPGCHTHTHIVGLRHMRASMWPTVHVPQWTCVSKGRMAHFTCVPKSGCHTLIHLSGLLHM